MSVKKFFAALFAAAFIIMTALPVLALPSETSENETELPDDNSEYQYESIPEDTSWQDDSTLQNSYDEYYFEQQESYEDNNYQDSYSNDNSYNYPDDDDDNDNDYNDYSYSEESYYQEESYSYYYEQDTDESSYYENEESFSDDENEYQESFEESFEESYEESIGQSIQESAEESSGLSITDPFAKLTSMHYILPSDDPNYIAKQKKEDSNAAAGSIRHNSGLLDSPPMPLDNSVSALNYKEDDDSTFLVGIIFWTVIAIVLTILLIFIINLKGSGNSNSFGRKRYHKNTYKPSKKSHSSYRISGR